MQLIYTLLILCVAMAVLKVALMVLVVILGIGLLCCTIRHLAEAIGLTLLMTTMSLIEAHPWMSGAGLIATAIMAVIKR